MIVAFIGFGSFAPYGRAFGPNLIKAGFKLRVWAEEAKEADTLVSLGATLHPTPRQCVEGVSVVFSVLSDDSLTNAARGPDGFMHHSTSPSTLLAISNWNSKKAAELSAEWEARADRNWVSAVWLGVPDLAISKQVPIIYSNLKHKDSILPILQAITGFNVEMSGGVTGPYVMKRCLEFYCYTQMEAIAELTALAEKNGIPRSETVSLVEKLMPSAILQGFGNAIATRTFSQSQFSVEQSQRDGLYLLEESRLARCPMPLASALQNVYDECISRGYSHLDFSAFTLLASDRAGININKQ